MDWLKLMGEGKDDGHSVSGRLWLVRPTSWVGSKQAELGVEPGPEWGHTEDCSLVLV